MMSMASPTWLPALKAVHLIRSDFPRALQGAQFVYDGLLAELLVRRSSDRAGLVAKVCSDLTNQRVLRVARAEYRHIFAAMVATVFYARDLPLSDDLLKLLWRPLTRSTRRPVALMAGLIRLRWVDEPAAQVDRTLVARTKKERRQRQQDWKDGVLAEIDRLRGYRADQPGRGRKASAIIGGRRSTRDPDSWLGEAIRDGRQRARRVGQTQRPARRGPTQGLTDVDWQATAVSRWLEPLAPDFLEESWQKLTHRQLDELRARVVRPAAPKTQSPTSVAPPLPCTRKDAMLLLPDTLWKKIERLVERASRTADPRSAMLGIILQHVFGRGWNWLRHFHWLGVSYSTCRRVDGQLATNGLWPKILAAAKPLDGEATLAPTMRVFRERAGV